MKKMKKLFMLFTVLLLCACMLSACGKGKTDAAMESSKDFVYRNEALSVNEQVDNIDTLFMAGDSIFLFSYEWGEAQSKNTIYQLNDDGSGQEILQFTNESNAYYTNFCGDNNGHIYALRSVYPIYYDEEKYIDDELLRTENSLAAVENTEETGEAEESDTETYYLMQFDLQGNMLWEICLNEEAALLEDGVDYFYINFVACDGEGNSYIGTNGKISVFDQSGMYARELSISGEDEENIKNSISNILFLDNGKVMLTYYGETGNMFVELEKETGKLGEKYSLPGSGYQYYSFYKGKNYDLLLSDNANLYGYNFGDEEATKLMNYLDSDLDVYGLGSIISITDTEFLATMSDYETGMQELYKFTKVKPEDVKERKVITLACTYTDWEVKTAVVKFNKTNEQYRIKMLDYGEMYNTEEDYSVGLTRLNADIASGNTPDILLLEQGMPIESYISKGLFADLKTMIDSDVGLDINQFVPNVIEALSTDDHLYRIAPRYSINTIVGKTSVVGSTPGWTLTDAKNILASRQEGTQLFGDLNQWSILYMSMTLGGDQFIDWESGKCNYNSPAFIEFLEFAAGFPTEEEANIARDEDFWNEYDNMWREDRALLLGMYINSLRDYNYSRHRLFGEDITMIGFPVESGVGNSIYTNLQMAISSKSESKEGAWEFVRYFLTDEYQETILYDLPLSVNQMDKLFDEATQKPYHLDQDGNKVEYDDTYYMNDMEIIIEPMTKEEVEEIKEAIYAVDQLSVYDADVLNIIVEESAPFFAGEKTVQEVADIIQSRVQIYVSESR